MKSTPVSPQARLVASRQALVRQMSRDEDGMSDDATHGLNSSRHQQQTADTQDRAGRSSSWQIFTQAVGAWWQNHPAQFAIDIGRPYLNSYARDKPLQLLGIAAGIGAAAVLVKPWRLVSATGLAVSLLKSTRLPAALLSLLPRRPIPAAQQQSAHIPEKYNNS